MHWTLRWWHEGQYHRPLQENARKEVFVFAIVTADPGKGLFKGAAVDELSHDLFHHRAERSILGFVGVGVAVYEGGVVSVGALTERGGSRITVR